MPQPSMLSFLGLGREASGSYGTAVPATGWIPITSEPKPVDNIKYLEDKGWRGSMTEDYGEIPGPWMSSYAFDGDVYMDSIGYLLRGILGDVTYSGTSQAPTGTLSSGTAVGATSLSSSVSIPNGTLIQVDVGVNAEVVTTSGAPTGAGPYAIPVPALAKAHLSGVAVTAITTPNVATFALLNSGNGQPPSYTISDYYTVNTRYWPGLVFSEVGFKFNADGLLTYTAKAEGLPSSPTSKPVPNFTPAKATANWTGVTKIGGVATKLIDGEFSIKRKVSPIQLVNGTQAPAQQWAGPLSVDGKMTLVMEDDTHITNYTGNVQPSVDVTWASGAGATATSLDLNLNNAAYTAAVINRSKDWVEVEVTIGKAIANAANAGYSGGVSPITATLKNAIASGTY